MRGEYPGASLWTDEAVNNLLRPDKGSCITRGDSIFVKLRLGAVCKRGVIYRGRPAEKAMRGAPLVKNGVPIRHDGGNKLGADWQGPWGFALIRTKTVQRVRHGDVCS
jgi:hypothetical protein